MKIGILIKNEDWGEWNIEHRDFFSFIDYAKSKGDEVYAVLLGEEGNLHNELNKRDILYKRMHAQSWYKQNTQEKLNTSADIFNATIKLVEILKKWNVDTIFSTSFEFNIGLQASVLLNKPHVWHFRHSLDDSTENKFLVNYKDLPNYLSTRTNFTILHSNFRNLDKSKFETIYEFSGLKPQQLINNKRYTNKVDVIVPFYDDPHTLKLMDSLLKHKSKSLNKIYIIDDKGKNRKIAKQVKDKVNENSVFKYLENEENRGFVYTCNKGMNLSKNDIILLNSDTLVTKNWLEKLKRIAYEDKEIGTVTPLSNSAGYFSIPRSNVTNRDDDPDLTNKILEQYSPYEYIEAHSAHGFCMYIKRNLINNIGIFNEKKFGKGYGEENDFSMRAHRKGFRNVLSCKTYILHLHGQSFGETREEHKKGKMKILTDMYPELLQLLQQFEIDDQLRPIREMISHYRFNKSLKAEHSESRAEEVYNIIKSHNTESPSHLSGLLNPKIVKVLLTQPIRGILKVNLIKLQHRPIPGLIIKIYNAIANRFRRLKNFVKRMLSN